MQLVKFNIINIDVSKYPHLSQPFLGPALGNGIKSSGVVDAVLRLVDCAETGISDAGVEKLVLRAGSTFCRGEAGPESTSDTGSADSKITQCKIYLFNM